VKVRAAIRKGAIDADKVRGILAILRDVRQQPDTKPYLARSLDTLFMALEWRL
jgi:hypothetical protein